MFSWCFITSLMKLTHKQKELLTEVEVILFQLPVFCIFIFTLLPIDKYNNSISNEMVILMCIISIMTFVASLLCLEISNLKRLKRNSKQKKS